MERLFITLNQSAAVTWKGAYHENPGYTHLYGWAKLQEDLSDMREEVKKIRDEAELRRKMGIKLR
jgi:hydroxylamine dehydrogenase